MRIHLSIRVEVIWILVVIEECIRVDWGWSWDGNLLFGFFEVFGEAMPNNIDLFKRYLIALTEFQHVYV